MKKQSVKVIHYNRSKEEINLSSKENRSKIEAIISDVINRVISK